MDNIFECKPIKIEIKELLVTYNNEWGQLNYFLLNKKDIQKIDLPESIMKQCIMNSQIFSIDNEDSFKGKSICVKDFLGDFVDVFRRHLQEKSKGYSCSLNGYEYAFFSPPYGLDIDFETAYQRYQIINDYFFGSMTDKNLTIFKWDTNFSDYFLNDWWDYCWSVWVEEKQHMVIIYGTATD